VMFVCLELRGGLEIISNGKQKQQLEIPPMTIKEFLVWLQTNITKEKSDLLFSPSSYTIRPGVLLLVNDVDGELIDFLNYQLQNGDEVSFISTLHGG